MDPVNIFWFRRDLRLEDNVGLYHALTSGLPVVPLFIFDTSILDQLGEKADTRVTFIHKVVEEIQTFLQHQGSTLEARYGKPLDAFEQICKKYLVKEVFANHDYEPYARARDNEVGDWLTQKGITFQTFKDQVIFEKEEVLKADGKPYTVFTPYSRSWKARLQEHPIHPFNSLQHIHKFYAQSPHRIPSLKSMGFELSSSDFPSKRMESKLISEYGQTRDYPAIDGTTRMGIHLRFGTISVRALVKKALESSEVYLGELIWREFYQMIIWHFPQVGKGRSFKPEYDRIHWRYDEDAFGVWCEGRTGYPLVDAGMRELNATGHMHNRVRMVTASFLAKHLLIDWRWGEAYFANKLLDFELASNNGNWQWAAGCGCDAAPYFRIFNPMLQAAKFDKASEYIRRWVPEYGTSAYPAPMVDHEFARARCLAAYSKALKGA